jgi:Metallo-beta-lactamase superfamily
MQVADGVHRLTKGVVNFYLIEAGGKLTLVDAGAPGDWETFERAAGSLGRMLADLDAVLLTHAHSDHTGFAERARTQAEAAVWIHGADAEAARTGAAPKNEAGFGTYLFRLEAYRTLFGLMRRKGLKIVPIHEGPRSATAKPSTCPGGRASCMCRVTPMGAARSSWSRNAPSSPAMPSPHGTRSPVEQVRRSARTG